MGGAGGERARPLIVSRQGGGQGTRRGAGHNETPADLVGQPALGVRGAVLASRGAGARYTR